MPRKTPRRKSKSRSRKRVSKSRRRSKSRKNGISPGKRRCNKLLSSRVRDMMHEYKKGRWVSRQQAIAVAYSKVKRDHPSCRKYYSRK